jgi:hypothetical protein
MLGFKILYVFIFIGINILHAYHDCKKIQDHKKIYHGLNGLFYIILLIPVYFHLKNWFFLVGLLSLRRVVFDTALNLFRGLSFDYISSTTTSIIDRLSYSFQKRYGYVIYYGLFILVLLLSMFI